MAPFTHQYLSNLTPLRGIAALWVFTFHFNPDLGYFVPESSTHLVSKGYLMVDLFFIMSGFIIMHVYQKSFESGLNPKNFKRFFVARFARIYPLHLFTLIVLMLWVWRMDAHPMLSYIMSPAAIPTHLALLHSFGIHDVFTWNVPSWSISAEWWAYIAFPFLALFLSRWKKPAALVLLLFVVLSYFALMFWLPRKDPFNPAAIVPHNLDISFDYGFLRGLAGFVSGMLVYKIYESNLFRKIFQQDWMSLLIILPTLYFLHVGINDGFFMILFSGIVYCFACNRGTLHSICNFRFAQYLGKISYSIYLVSGLVGFSLKSQQIRLPGILINESGGTSAAFLTGLGWFLLILTINIGLSSLTYYGIEKPCRKFINNKWGKEAMPVYA